MTDAQEKKIIFEDFRMSDWMKPTEKQLECIQATDKYKYTLFGGAGSGGKALALDTPVPTPHGWTTIGDIKPGDMVFSETGEPCTVKEISPVMLDRPVMLVTFRNGEQIKADAEHEWYSFSEQERQKFNRRTDAYRERRREKRPKRGKGVKPWLAERNSLTAKSSDKAITGTIRETKYLSIGDGIQLSKSIELPERGYILDPYLLGLWLGDGTAHMPDHTTDDHELLRYWKESGFKVEKLKHQHYRIHGLRDILNCLGLLRNKHIPAPYLRGSSEQRLALLQGLMDTDGCCNKDGQSEFCNTNLSLANGVYELAASLGVRPTFTAGRATLYGKDCGEKYTVKWTSTLPAFRLTRKLANLPKSVSKANFHYVKSVEPIESVPVRCIEVDSPSHLFLVGRSFIPTHNSYLLRWWLLRQLIRRFNKTGIVGLRAGLFSMDFPTLQQRQISKMEHEFPGKWFGTIKSTEKEGRCYYINEEYGGGRLALCNLFDPSSYKSAEFCDIGVEELTENPREVLEDLILFRLRWPGISDPRFLGATNPTGPGMQWVKQLWIDRKFPPELEHLKDDFHYVPALPKDNPHISPDYIKSLRGLPEKKRKALLEGDWTIPEGQYFTNFERSKRAVHQSIVAQIVKPWWPVWISQDWGFKHHSPVHWHTVGKVMPHEALMLGRDWDTPRECVFTFQEYVTSIADTQSSERELGQTLVRLTGDRKIRAHILSTDAFAQKSTQRTPADLISEETTKHGFPMPRRADMTPGSRIAGWRFMYQLIQDDEWFISEMCPLALDAVPALEYDKDKGGEDILKTDSVYDDVGDELRYGLADMLNSARKPVSEEKRDIWEADPERSTHSKVMQQLAFTQQQQRNVYTGRKRTTWAR